jgi:hypothetical protein
MLTFDAAGNPTHVNEWYCQPCRMLAGDASKLIGIRLEWKQITLDSGIRKFPNFVGFPYLEWKACDGTQRVWEKGWGPSALASFQAFHAATQRWKVEQPRKAQTPVQTFQGEIYVPQRSRKRWYTNGMGWQYSD